MYKVTVSKRCNCFTKSGMKASFCFENEEEVYNYAKKTVDKMNKDFCNKHIFNIVKIIDNYFITFNEDDSDSDKTLKCCGSGCCNLG